MRGVATDSPTQGGLKEAMCSPLMLLSAKAGDCDSHKLKGGLKGALRSGLS